LINKERGSGRFKGKGKNAGVGAGFGQDRVFLDSLPSDLVYFADVLSGAQVFPERPEMILPEYCGRGARPAKLVPTIPAKAVKDLVAEKSAPWNDMALGNGPTLARDKLVRVVEIRDGKSAKEVWIYARELGEKSIKYSLRDAPIEAKLEDFRFAGSTRWPIEQCFDERKTYLGMGHCEARTLHGWRRRISLTLIAHLFATKLKIRFPVSAGGPGPAPTADKPAEADERAEAAMIH
jgi:hypothetical protein